MTLMEHIFPVPEPTKDEIILLTEIFKNPVVIKYLRYLAHNNALELLQISTAGKSAEDIRTLHTQVMGRLESISTLLSISQGD